MLSLTAILLCGCSDSIKYEASSIQIHGSFDGTEIDNELSLEDAEYLISLWNDAEWSDGMLKFRYPLGFEFDDTVIEYAPDVYVFYDRENDRSFEVPKEHYERIESIIGLQ